MHFNTSTGTSTPPLALLQNCAFSNPLEHRENRHSDARKPSGWMKFSLWGAPAIKKAIGARRVGGTKLHLSLPDAA
jgi:hypothetical protein